MPAFHRGQVVAVRVTHAAYQFGHVTADHAAGSETIMIHFPGPIAITTAAPAQEVIDAQALVDSFKHMKGQPE